MSPVFKYHARDTKGVINDGIMGAIDEQDAVEKLHRQGLIVISIKTTSVMPIPKKKWRYSPIQGWIFLLCIVGFFILFCGIFVIQPIGAVPRGTTIVYWRFGTKMSFIASADGLAGKSGLGVSLLDRGIVLGGLAKTINSRALFRLPYSKTLYLISTNGKEYEK